MDRICRILLCVFCMALALPALTGGEPASAPDKAPRVDLYGDPLPEGAVVRLGTVRLRHGHYIRHAALSPDGKLLASCGKDAIRLWDLNTGREVRELASRDGGAGSLAISPDGQLLATGQDDGTIRIWDVRKGEVTHHLALDAAARRPDWPARTLALAFSPDGKTLATGSSDGFVRLWDSNTWTVRSVLYEHSKEIHLLSWAPDQGILISASEDNIVRVWSPGEKKPRLTIPAFKQVNGAFLAVSPDSTLLVTGNPGLVELSIWNPKDGKELNRLRVSQDAKPDKVSNWFLDARFLPGGKHLITSHTDRILKWDMTTLKSSALSLEGLKFPGRMELSADGQLLVSYGERAIRLYDLLPGRERLPLHGHEGMLWHSVWSPDGQRILTSDYGELRSWNPRTKKSEILDIPRRFRIENFAVSPDASTLVIADWDRLYWYDLRAGRLISEDSAGLRHEGLDFARGDSLLAGGATDQRTVSLIDATSRKLSTALPAGTGRPKCLALSHDGAKVVAGSWEKTIALWDVPGRKLIREWQGHTGSVYSVAFSPDDKTLATVSCHNDFIVGAGRDQFVRLWDSKSTGPIAQFGNHEGGYFQAVYSPDGRMLATAGQDGMVRVWEAATGKERLARSGHRGAVTSVAFAPHGRQLLSTSSDTTALIWDLTLGIEEEQPGSRTLGAKDLDDLFSALASDDAAKAYKAIWSLVAAPKESVPFLAERLKPALAVDEKRIAELIAALDSEKFAEREKAVAELEKLGEAAGPALEKLLKGTPAPEAKRRAEALVAKLGGPVTSPEQLRTLRAIEALEHIGTPEATQVIEKLAKGAAGARETEDAKRSLERLKKRKKD